jgi:membrane protease YdiL (CAAX protease family)
MSQTLTSDAVNSNDQTWEPPMWGLIAFTLFAVTVIVLDFYLVYQGPYELHKKLSSYTGIAPSTFYLFSLIFVAFYLYGKNRKNFFRGKPTGVIGTVGLMMVSQILFGLYHQIMHAVSEDRFYKETFSPIQSIYTIVLPLLWLLVLFYPYIRQRFSR